MNHDFKHDRRVGGIKAKRLLELGEDQSNLSKEQLEDISVILVISPWHNRIISVLKTILSRTGKKLALTGVDLYRKALSRIEGDLANRVVALVITDKPDDCNAPARGDKPLWQETIISCQQKYLQQFEKEINDNIFPPFLTVVTLFKSQRGKMERDEIQKLEKDFEEFRKENQFKQVNCKNEEEMNDVMDREIVSMVLKRQRQREKLKKFERTRAQKIAKAKNVTKSAYQKNIYKKE